MAGEARKKNCRASNSSTSACVRFLRDSLGVSIERTSARLLPAKAGVSCGSGLTRISWVRQPRLREHFNGLSAREEAQMADIQYSSPDIAPFTVQQPQHHIEIAYVGKADIERTLRSKQGPQSLQHGPGVHQVFEHIGRHDGIDAPGQQTFRFEIDRLNGCFDHTVVAGARASCRRRRRLDADHFDLGEPPLEPAARTAAKAAYVQHASRRGRDHLQQSRGRVVGIQRLHVQIGPQQLPDRGGWRLRRIRRRAGYLYGFHVRSAVLGYEAAASRSISAFLRSTPQAYPDREPSLRTTRWQGMATAMLLEAQAPATARTARGAPMMRAISE